MFTSIQKFLKGSKISESTNYQKPHIKTTDLRSLKKYANLPFILESNDALLARGSKGNGNYWPKSE